VEINRIYQEPCLETLKRMPDKFLDCVITSPPYWQLRDYGYPEQWGLEPTFTKYLEHLWSMMDEIFRVLKDEGTVWVNLGDSYSGSGGSGGDYLEGGLREKQPIVRPPKINIKSKCLLLLPHRFAIGCIDRGWIVRNDCIWAKRNGMPESVTDRFTKKHEYFFFMVKQEKYFFNLNSIKDKVKQVSIDRLQRGISDNNKWVDGAVGQTPHGLSQPRKNITTKIPKDQSEIFGSPRARQHRGDGHVYQQEDNGKNPGSVSDFWDISTKPSNNKHYASYNDELLLKPVLAGCPEGGIIYDPFMGTGPIFEAAHVLKARATGIELDQASFGIAVKRIEQLREQQ